MEEKFENLYDMTRRESGVIIYQDGSAAIINWLSYDGIPRLFTGGFLALGEELEIEEAEELTSKELKDIAENLEVFYDANDDLPELLEGKTGGKIYTLTTGEKIITPDGWH